MAQASDPARRASWPTRVSNASFVCRAATSSTLQVGLLRRPVVLECGSRGFSAGNDICDPIVDVENCLPGPGGPFAGCVLGGESDEGVARPDVEVDVGQRLEMVAVSTSGNKPQKEPELADLDGLLHDVDAVEVVDDDRLQDEVADSGGWTWSMTAWNFSGLPARSSRSP